MKAGVLIANAPLFQTRFGPSCIATLGVPDEILWVNVPDVACGARTFPRVYTTAETSVFREEGHA